MPEYYINDIHNSKDNQTIELFDNYPYFPEYERNIEFGNKKLCEEWDKLDELSSYILYLNVCLKYKLKEIAEILNLRHDYVRTKKSRAFKTLKTAVKQKEEVT